MIIKKIHINNHKQSKIHRTQTTVKLTVDTSKENDQPIYPNIHIYNN